MYISQKIFTAHTSLKTSSKKEACNKPRWGSGLSSPVRWFANSTHRGTGFRIPPLPRAEFGRLASEWHNWLVTPGEGRETQQGGGLRSPHFQHLGRLESRQSVECVRLEEGVCFSGDRQILSGAARDGVYAVNLKLIARGNWRNVGVIDYQIGIKREKKRKRLVPFRVWDRTNLCQITYIQCTQILH